MRAGFGSQIGVGGTAVSSKTSFVAACGRGLVLRVADCLSCRWGRRHCGPAERRRAPAGLLGPLVTLVLVLSRLGPPLSVEVLRALGLRLPLFAAGWRVSVAELMWYLAGVTGKGQRLVLPDAGCQGRREGRRPCGPVRRLRAPASLQGQRMAMALVLVRHLPPLVVETYRARNRCGEMLGW